MRLALLAFLLLLTLLDQASAERRLAFVAGINEYPNLPRERQLERAVQDAETVGETLKGLGFQVTRLTRGATQESFLRRFAEFVRAIEPGDTALFFFAGHGIALDGTNYLIPSDIPALSSGDERLVRTRSLAETDLITDIRERGARVTILVIDACRDNPFPKTGTRALGGRRGLAVKEPAEGVFSIYSAGFGQEALDRLPGDDASPNSVFTRVFVEQLKKPGVNLLDLGEMVREEVAALAKQANHPQVPAVYNQVLGARLVFLAGLAPAPSIPPVAVTPIVPPTPGLDEAMWSLLERTSDPRQIEDLVWRFPQSRLRPAWDARLLELRRQQTAALDGGRRAAAANPTPSVKTCFGSDRGAASTDPNDHLRWAETRDGKTITSNLSFKINVLASCTANDDQMRDVSAGLSVIIARYVPRAECFGGDRGVTIPARQPHWDWAAGKSRKELLSNLHWKTAAAIGCLDRAAQAKFFADMSNLIAKAAATVQGQEPTPSGN